MAFENLDYQPIQGLTGKFPELYKMLNFIGSGKASSAISSASNNRADVEASLAKQRWEQAQQEKIAAIQAAADPAKYQRVKKASGGYDFFDGAGNPITVEDYSQAKKIDKGEALKGSMDYQDIAFLRNYNATMDMMDAYYNQDGDKAKKITDQLVKSGVDPGKIMPKDVIAALYQHFPNYFMTQAQKRELEKATEKRQSNDFYGQLSKWYE